MTLAEYEKNLKSQSAVKVDTTNAPKKMTLAEYEKQQASKPTANKGAISAQSFRAAEKANMAQNKPKPKPDANLGALSMQAFRAADKKNLADNPTLQPSTLPGVGISFLPDTSLAQSNDKATKTNVALSNASKNAGNLPTFQRVLAAADSGAESAIGGSINAVQTARDLLREKIVSLSPEWNTPEGKATLEKAAQQGAFGPGGALSEMYLGDKFMKSAQTKGAAATEGTSGAGKFALEGISSIANMATGALTAGLTGIPFAAQMGVQAGGSSAYDAKQQGKTLDQQFNYGLSTGIFAGITEGLGGIGASKVIKATTGKAVSSLLAKLPTTISGWLNSAGAKIGGKIIGDAISEGGEESLQYSADIVLQKLILNNDVPFDIKQMAYQALQGGVIGGLFGGATSTANAINNPQKPTPLTTPAEVLKPNTTPQDAPQSTIAPTTFSIAAEQTNAPQESVEAQNAKLNVSELSNEQKQQIVHFYSTDVYNDMAYDSYDARKAASKELAKAWKTANNNPNISDEDALYRVSSDFKQLENAGVVKHDGKEYVLVASDGLGAADAGFDPTGNKLQDMITDYGAIKPGKGNITTERIVELPKQTSPDKNVMQTMRTIMEAPVVTNGTAEVLEKMVVDEKFSRFVNTDKMALEAARTKILNDGYVQSLKKFSDSMAKGNVSKNNVALGFTLLNAAESVGDSKTAVDIITNMVDNIRDAAQTLQAVKILKKMQPEYQLYAVQRSVENLQNELIQKYGDKAPNIQIDQELAQAYLDALYNGDEALGREKLTELYKSIARQMPPTFADKWNAWRYMAMLTNPITHIKNIVSNTVFRGERFIKDVLSTAIEMSADKLSKNGIDRTKAFLTKSDAKLIEEADAMYAEDAEAIYRYGKYNEWDNIIQENRTIFKNSLLEKGRKLNTAALTAEDAWVSRPAYVKALASYMKANGATSLKSDGTALLDKARGYAIDAARKASYRDSNAVSDFVSNLKFRQNNPLAKAANELGEGLLPFRRTPANVLVAGIEYSPVGFITTLAKHAKRAYRGDFNASAFIDDISANLTGTAVLAVGMLLAKLNIISVGSSGDDKEDKFSETQGNQQFAINLGGKSYTIPWLAPPAMALFMGVSVYNKLNDESANGITMKDALKIASDISNPVLETSMLSGLNDFFEGIPMAKQQDTNTLYYIFSQAAMGYLGQAVPTLGGRISNVINSDRRTYFTNSQSGLPNDVQYFLQKQQAKIPFASSALPKYVDQWGRTQSNGSVPERLLQNFLSPGYLKSVNTSPMEIELQRLYTDYAKENKVNVLPPVSVDKYFTNNGEKVYMNADEYTQYKITRGQYAYKELTRLTASQDYKWMTDKEKAKAVSDVYSDAADVAKAQILNSK